MNLSKINQHCFTIYESYKDYIYSLNDICSFTIQNNRNFSDSSKNCIIYLARFQQALFKFYESNSLHPLISCMIFFSVYTSIDFLNFLSSESSNANVDRDFSNYLKTILVSLDLNSDFDEIKNFLFSKNLESVYFPSNYNSEIQQEILNDSEKNENFLNFSLQFLNFLLVIIKNFENYINQYNFFFLYKFQDNEKLVDSDLRKIISGSIISLLNNTIEHITTRSIDLSLFDSFIYSIGFTLKTFSQLTIYNIFKPESFNYIETLKLNITNLKDSEVPFLIFAFLLIQITNILYFFSIHYNKSFFDSLENILVNEISEINKTK